MLDNIEDSLTATDYRAIDYPGLLKLEDILNYLKGCQYISSYSQKVDKLVQLQKSKKINRKMKWFIK